LEKRNTAAVTACDIIEYFADYSMIDGKSEERKKG
jgi:hypothetical protein